MAIDQFIVDRAFGGRFEPKDGWLYATLDGGKSYKVGDVLKDNYPDNNVQKAYKPGTRPLPMPSAGRASPPTS